MALPTEKPEVETKQKRAGGGARKKGEQGEDGGTKTKAGIDKARKRDECTNTIRVAAIKLPPTLGYSGTRVGEAKNPGPGEDLDVEILGGSGAEDLGEDGGSMERRQERRSRPPPLNT